MTSVRQMNLPEVQTSPVKPLRSAKSYMTPTSSSKARVAARLVSNSHRPSESITSTIIEEANLQNESPERQQTPCLNATESECGTVQTSLTRSVIDYNGKQHRYNFF